MFTLVQSSVKDTPDGQISQVAQDSPLKEASQVSNDKENKSSLEAAMHSSYWSKSKSSGNGNPASNLRHVDKPPANPPESTAKVPFKNPLPQNKSPSRQTPSSVVVQDRSAVKSKSALQSQSKSSSPTPNAAMAASHAYQYDG